MSVDARVACMLLWEKQTNPWAKDRGTGNDAWWYVCVRHARSTKKAVGKHEHRHIDDDHGVVASFLCSSRTAQALRACLVVDAVRGTSTAVVVYSTAAACELTHTHIKSLTGHAL